MNGGGFFTEPFGFFSVVARQNENEAFFLVKKKRPFHKKSFQTTSKSENRGQTLFLLAYKAGGA